jgi:uncharacterized Zn finger protein
MSRWNQRRYSSRYDFYPPYVPVAERKARAAKEAAKLLKKGGVHQPVVLEGKTIARTFWGKAWCQNLESYSDYSNRLPRGRSYVRNGSVLHLDIRRGEIEALVSGRSLYTIKIGIQPVGKARWDSLRGECAGSIGSLMELLAGKLSDRVMGVMTSKERGLFPAPSEIALDCSCPDWADMCKHVAAVLYGVGARLDEKPELLFLLRHVDHRELVGGAGAVAALTKGKGTTGVAVLENADVADVFGIELTGEAAVPVAVAPVPKAPRSSAKNKKGKRPAQAKREPAPKTTRKQGRGKAKRKSARHRAVPRSRKLK